MVPMAMDEAVAGARHAYRRSNTPLQVAGSALSILAALTIGMALHLTVISQLQYQRNQQTAFANFRTELKLGTAPVGQFRVEFDDRGQALPARPVEPGSPVAVLRIPAIGLQTLVVEGTGGDVLRQ